MENAPFLGAFFLNKIRVQTLIQRKETNMDKTLLTITGSVIIAWTLATINDSQEIKTAEFTLNNQSTIVQEVKWRLRDTSSYTIYRCRPSSYFFSNNCV